MTIVAPTVAQTSTFGSKLKAGIAKTVGYAGLAAIAYDAHKLGQLRADEYKKSGEADNTLDAYMDTKSLSNPSALMNKIQGKRMDAELNGHFLTGPRNFLNKAKGYIKGFCESITNNVVPLALSAATVLTKGKFSKISAAGLTLFAGVSVAKNALGAGKTHLLK